MCRWPQKTPHGKQFVWQGSQNCSLWELLCHGQCFAWCTFPAQTSASSEVSAFFMLPYCRCSVVAAVSVGFASSLQGIPVALPLADTLLLKDSSLPERRGGLCTPTKAHSLTISWMLLTSARLELQTAARSSPPCRAERRRLSAPAQLGRSRCLPHLPLHVRCGRRGSSPVCRPPTD